MMQGDGWGLPLQWVAGFRLVPPISLFGKKKPRQLGRSRGTLAGGVGGTGGTGFAAFGGFWFHGFARAAVVAEAAAGAVGGLRCAG